MLYRIKIVVGFLLTVTTTVAQTQQKPNVLYIMADDHTTSAIGVYNSHLAKLNPTPNIDKLANEGVVFENTFCNNAICTPSRASILTGQYSHVNGIVGNNNPLDSSRQYLALEMKQAGYETAVIGKWHLIALPNAFDHYQVLPKQGKYGNPLFKVKGKNELLKFQGHSSDVIASSAINWMTSRTNKEKPFFLNMHFKAPHGPFKNAARYNTYLEDVVLPEPPSLRNRGNGSIATFGVDNELEKYISSSVADRHPEKNWLKFISEEYAGDDLLGAAYQEYVKRYLRCVKGVDDNVGRVVAYLKETGQYENTVIIYAGDQGFFLGEHDKIDKRMGYEEAMRMPFIVHYPKTIKARRSDAIVENIDFAPTILDFAGEQTPEYMNGVSVLPILKTGKEPNGWKNKAYYQYYGHLSGHYNPGHIAMRTKNYRIILYHGMDTKGKGKWQTPAAWEMYDVKEDPYEMNNVYDDPAYEDVVVKLKNEFEACRKEIGVDVSQHNIHINKVVNEYWDYTDEDRAKAEQISHEVRVKFENREWKNKGTYKRDRIR